MPKSALTGSQKKTFRQGNKTGRRSLKEIERSLKPGENLRQYGKSYELAQQMMQPQVQEARRQFQQEEAPQMISDLGMGNRSSSALNQALASAMTNLNHRMTGQTQQLAAQLAESDMNRRMQAAQYGGQVGQNMMNVSPYLPSSGQPGVGKQLLGHGIDIAAGAAGTFFGGPGGGMAAYQLSNQATQKLKGTNKANAGAQEAGQWGGNKMLEMFKPQAGA